jgi:hypothetical protein
MLALMSALLCALALTSDWPLVAAVFAALSVATVVLLGRLS